MVVKNFNDIIADRTRDLPTCSEVPQPTAPPRTPLLALLLHINQLQRVDGASVAADLKIRASATLLLTAECFKVWRWGGTRRQNLLRKFHHSPCTGATSGAIHVIMLH